MQRQMQTEGELCESMMGCGIRCDKKIKGSERKRCCISLQTHKVLCLKVKKNSSETQLCRLSSLFCPLSEVPPSPRHLTHRHKSQTFKLMVKERTLQRETFRHLYMGEGEKGKVGGRQFLLDRIMGAHEWQLVARQQKRSGFQSARKIFSLIIQTKMNLLIRTLAS